MFLFSIQMIIWINNNVKIIGVISETSCNYWQFFEYHILKF